MSPAPVVQRFGDEISVGWPGRISCYFTHWQERFGILQAEVSVRDGDSGEIGWGQVAPISHDGRAKFAKHLPDPDMAELFYAACRLAVASFRTPPEVRQLEPRRRGALPWFWTDWVPANQTTVFYGDGDSGKSFLALTLAVCSLSGLPFAGTFPIARSEGVLYLDYETEAEDHEDRLAAICGALEVPDLKGRLHHLELTRPLTEMADSVRMWRGRTKSDVVILDSLGAATAGEIEGAQGAIGAMNVLRSLGRACTRIVLAHVSKLDASSGGTRKVYGSVYNRNLPRANVEVRKDETADELAVSLRVDKNNLLRRKPATLGLTLSGTEPDAVWSVSLPAPTATGIKYRILAMLQTDEELAMSTEFIANTLEIDPSVTRATLNRMANEGSVRRVTTMADRAKQGKGGRYAGSVPNKWIRVLSRPKQAVTPTVTPG